jgi:hypothetical protein
MYPHAWLVGPMINTLVTACIWMGHYTASLVRCTYGMNECGALSPLVQSIHPLRAGLDANFFAKTAL